MRGSYKRPIEAAWPSHGSSDSVNCRRAIWGDSKIMSGPETPARFEPPSGKNIALSVVGAMAVATLVLVTIIWPAEYGRDPTGIGSALGLTALRAPVRTIEIGDTIGGNEAVREAEIPDFGEPVPLPNPNVHQDEPAPPQTRQFEITIPAEAETEVKTVLREGKMIVYSWHTDRGTIYSDFHGHNPEFGQEFFVRYREHQEGAGGNGSLAAPFDGEHGWYWLNYNDFPVTVSLTVTGFFDDTIDYGIF